MKGISQQLLNSYRQKNPNLNLPLQTKNLSDQQVTYIFRDEFFDRPNIGKLANTVKLNASKVRLAEQIFDSGVLHGVSDAGRWLQQSLDSHLGTDLRLRADGGTKKYDGIIGTKTRAAVARAVREGKIAIVNDDVVARRIEYILSLSVEELEEFGESWLRRANLFRIKWPSYR